MSSHRVMGWPALLALAILATFLPGTAWAKKEGRPVAAGELPKFDPPADVYPDRVAVTLRAGGAGTQVAYTLDGSEPDDHSPRFSAPLTLTNSTLVRARLVGPGAAAGPVASAHYLVLDADLAGFSSNLPLIVVDSSGAELSRDRKDLASVRVIDLNGRRATLQSPGANQGPAVVNIRGRASLRYPKRSYTLKLVDDEGEDRPSVLLGMPKDEDWVLYAPYPDKTLMRDVLAYEISRAMGHWAPRTRFVEVFVTDGRKRLSMADYAGVYVLEERLKRSASRVNLHKLSPRHVDEPEVSGGYIFKKDHVDRGYYGPPDLLGGGIFTSSSTNRNGYPTAPGGFPADPKGFLPTYHSSSRSRDTSESNNNYSNRRSPRPSGPVTNSLTRPVPRPDLESGNGQVVYMNDDGSEFSERAQQGFATTLRTNQFYYVEPEEDEITLVQKGWLKGFLDDFETSLYGSNFLDPKRGYRASIDPVSFVDYHLIVEVTKNVDGHRFSTFFSKDRGGLLQAQPIWDWNLSFGNCNGKQGWIPEYWLWPQLSDQEYLYFRRLFEDPDFGQQYVDRWGALRSTAFSPTNLLARIDELARLLDESQRRNFERWPILGKGVNPNWFVGETYEEEVSWMKEWLAKRLAWIDAQFVPVPQCRMTAGTDGASQLEWRPGAGELYYTLDGTDPRTPGGKPSASARRGSPPDHLDRNARLVARALVQNRWSSPLVLGP